MALPEPYDSGKINRKLTFTNPLVVEFREDPYVSISNNTC